MHGGSRLLPQLEALSILAVWCRGIGGTPFGSGPLQQITSEVPLSFIAGEGPLNTRRARLPSDRIEPLPHFLDPRCRRLGAEQLPQPCAGFGFGPLLREPFLDGGPLAHRR